jgi:hypothetical protein
LVKKGFFIFEILSFEVDEPKKTPSLGKGRRGKRKSAKSDSTFLSLEGKVMIVE